MKLRKLLATIALTAMTVSAQAGLISVVGGQDFVAPGTNDFVAGDTYNVGGNVFADFDIMLTFTYLGKEAAFDNDFNALGNTVFLSNMSNAVGDSASGSSSAGLIDFNFFANDVGTGVMNGANNMFGAVQSFAAILDFTWGDGTIYDLVLFFDDSGANFDDDHDDHIIGVTATRLNIVQVSAPGAIALLGLGLLGMSAARRKRV